MRLRSTRRLSPVIALFALGLPFTLRAQDMSGMDMSGQGRAAPNGMAATPGMARDVASAPPMSGMEMGGMTGALGSYPMMRDASGTAWQPDSSPMESVDTRFGPWAAMLHGFATLIYDDQGGLRGADKTFSTSMLMAMAQREAGGGTLTLRGMMSLDPLMGPSGYPLLLQTGETPDGRTELVDRQHPHDLFMELAGAYSHPISGKLGGFVYFGYPGEPALGPATFMHRFSGEVNPEAPIGHHWLDSTHVTFGVATAGLTYGPVKLEASSFTGREPDQHRYDFDRPRFDSWSVRATWNPTSDLSFQASTGWLHSPEQLTPDVDQRRTTASATYNRALAWQALKGDWQTTFAWGRDDDRPGNTTDAYLLESALSLGRHTLFGRAEWVGKSELFANQPTNPLRDRVFDVGKVSLGYSYTLRPGRWIALDVGGLISRYILPEALDPYYGAEPTSFMLFTRIRLAR